MTAVNARLPDRLHGRVMDYLGTTTMALANDCFCSGDGLMPLAQALADLDSRIQAVAGRETVPLRAALGRILAEDVISPINVPPHDNSAVDGYAVFAADLGAGETRLPVTGRIAAGHPLPRPARRGEALRIFTGAPMPAGPDSVVMQEDVRLDGEYVIIPAGVKTGANRRHAGEDVAAGTVALRQGAKLRPQEIALAAALGRTDLAVRNRLRVAIFSTGDEVFDPGAALPPGGIYDSNRYSLHGLLEQLGCAVTDLGILPDRFDTIRTALADAAASHDLLMTSGGVSVGDEDHVKAAVSALGSLHFWRLAIKPGRPVALGQASGVPFIGLPGNPVAVMVTFLLIARPMILRLSGAADAAARRYPVQANFAQKKKAGRQEFLRGRLVLRNGVLTAEKFGADGSGILSSMVQSEGLIDLAPEITEIAPGDMIQFLPFTEVMA